MKYNNSSLLLLIALLPSLLFCLDLEIKTSLGTQYAPAEGKVVYAKEFWKNSSGDIDHESSPNLYGWIECETDITLLPKFAFSFSNAHTQGNSFIHISANDLVNGIIDALEQNLPVTINDTEYTSRLLMQTYDFLLYYEFFEHSGWPTLGIGIDVKKFNFDYAVTIIDGLNFNDHGDGTVPMLYLKTHWDIRNNQKHKLSLELDGKQYVTGPSTIYDYRAKIEVMMHYNDTTMLGIELGYRANYFNIKGSDIVNLDGDMDTSGVYIGFRGDFK